MLTWTRLWTGLEGWGGAAKTGRLLITHLGPQLDYGDLQERLQLGIAPAYDGHIIEVPEKADMG